MCGVAHGGSEKEPHSACGCLLYVRHIELEHQKKQRWMGA